MLKFDEQEGQALVHATPTGPAEHVIFQTGKWISTDGRQLKAWAPDAEPAVARFRLSAVREAMLRDRFKAHRAQVMEATGQEDPMERLDAVQRLIVEETRVSMLIGVAVGYELAHVLNENRGDD